MMWMDFFRFVGTKWAFEVLGISGRGGKRRSAPTVPGGLLLRRGLARCFVGSFLLPRGRGFMVQPVREGNRVEAVPFGFHTP